MKLTAFILLMACISVSAKGFSQNITLSVKDKPIALVLRQIEDQSGCQILFFDDDIRSAQPVTLYVKNAPLEQVLQECFKNQPLTYTLTDKTIVVKLKAGTKDKQPAYQAAQDTSIHVHGKVTDQEGKPLAGVSVGIRGRKNAVTMTNAIGEYELDCPSDATLVFNYVGYALTPAKVDGHAVIDIRLTESAQSLDKIVVVAYGTTRQSLYTGAAAQIEAKDFEKRPLDNVTNALVGAAPGIQTTQAGGAPGDGADIRLRGFGSYSASSSPLIVVDGAPYDGTIDDIDPADIASVSVLKDASTTALYGSRAANGVIILTTKKGKKGTSHLSFRASTGIVRRGLPEYDRVNAYQYYPLMWQAYRNTLVDGGIPQEDADKIASGQYERFTSGANEGLQNYNGNAYSDISQLLVYNPFNVASDQIVNTDGTLNPQAKLLYPNDLDWSKAAQQGGRSRQNYELAYSGGTDKATYYGSFGYTNMKGYLIKSDMKRYNARLNIDVVPVKWFKTGLNITGTYIKENEDNAGSNTGLVNPFYFSRYVAPIYPVHLHDAQGALVLDDNGKPQYDEGDGRPFNAGRNSIEENILNQQLLTRSLLSGRTYGEIDFTSHLNFRTNFSADIENGLHQQYENNIIGDGAPAGRSERYNNRYTDYTLNEIVSYNNHFGKHNIDVIAGHENYQYTHNYLDAEAQGQIVDGLTELPNFSSINSIDSYDDTRSIESYLARANYDFEGKYILSASIRRDGNSKFSPDVRWANFWSVGGAWNITKENFMKSKFFNELKLRASYGKVGNDGGISDYAYQALYDLGRNNAQEPGFVQGSLANDSLTWESNNSLDLGLDFSIFKNRLSGTIDYFNRESSGLIFDVPQPLSNGGTRSGEFEIEKNVGDMYNRGLEVQLVGQIIRSKNFNYTATLNWTTFKNNITRMPSDQPEIIDGTKKLSVGHSIYDYWLRHYYGVDPANGDALYTAQTYDPSNPGTTRIITGDNGRSDTVTSTISNAKYFYNSSSIPKFYGSLLNNFSYKNFSLSILLTYQVGGKIFDQSYQSLMTGGKYGTALSVDELKSWQKPGDITNVPRMDNQRMSDFNGTSDRWLTNGSYLNINNITLSYQIPKKWLSRISADEASIYVSGENLGLFNARKGMNVNGSFSGLTYNDYTYNRILSLGVNLNF